MDGARIDWPVPSAWPNEAGTSARGWRTRSICRMGPWRGFADQLVKYAQLAAKDGTCFVLTEICHQIFVSVCIGSRDCGVYGFVLYNHSV